MRSWLRLTLSALNASPSLRRNSRRMTLSRVTRVAVDVDPLDIDARRFADLERDVHHPLFGVAIVGRVDVGEGIAEVPATSFRPVTVSSTAWR